VIDMPLPDDELMAALLRRQFDLKAITPSQDLIDYLVRRMERSVGGIQQIVTDLQHYADSRAFNRKLAMDFFEHSENFSWLTDRDEI